MKKGILLCGFVFLLVGCGGAQVTLPNSADDSQNLATSSNPNGTSNKSNDKTLENFVGLTHSTVYNDYIVVELESSEGIKLDGNRLSVSSGRGAVGANLINQVLTRAASGFSLHGLFGNDLRQLENRAKQLKVLTGRDVKSLSHYFKISVTDPRTAESILRGLWKGAGLRGVYPGLKSIPTDPPGSSSTPDFGGSQGYLYSDATGGLNINVLWDAGIRGAGVTIADSENDWNPSHEDIPVSSGIGTSETGDNYVVGHGTAVLGILNAEHNAYGVKGIAPDANVVTSRSGGGEADVVAIINGTGRTLDPGDIFLYEYGIAGPHTVECGRTVEDQVGCIMPGAYPSFHAAIADAIANDLIVIETAGNGTLDFDESDDSFLSVGGPDLRLPEPNGAIVVGASTSGSGRSRMPWSNCGRRVDLHSWGENVVTTSYPGSWDWHGLTGTDYSNNPAQPNRYYTNDFGGTSSAGAIIAGATTLLQSYAKSEMGGKKYLTPAKIKEILIASGEANVVGGDCSIGVQPKMDVAKSLFDDFWLGVQSDYPELATGGEVRGTRRQGLQTRGVGLICKLYDPTNSDPSCPETARCVLDPTYQVEFFRDTPGHEWCNNSDWCFNVVPPSGEGLPYNNCQGVRCLPLNVEASDYDCIAGAIWPAGLRVGKTLDFDGDGKADLTNWTPTNSQIDLSGDDYGAWNVTLTPSAITSRWLWPCTEDYNSDGRADICVYDKEHGTWYIKFTDRNVLSGTWTAWDRTVTLPYHDALNLDVTRTAYGRPVPGDYNNDGYIDLAIARSDGIWSIDHGGPNASDYGSFDENITYLTSAQLAAAPGWAYLPINGFMTGISYKVPDGVTNAGEVFVYYSDSFIDDIYLSPRLLSYGGNETIPLAMYIEGDQFSIKKPDGTWRIADQGSDFALTTVAPDNIYGNLDCHPFVADFDGDGYEDRAVQCPTEFRLGLTSTDALRTVPLGYNRTLFSLPGKPYFGSVSYATTQRLIDWQRRSFPTTPPIIPVDMVSVGSCRLAFAPGASPTECR
ncbi:MAG: S8 family serine peptidase [Deltaproteobacteria bacterium]|nr:S8 family serine peptidase [Deltaproteobacteria bacterium]